MIETVPGKLKLFLGYAPGVGKTNAMLEAAQQRAQVGERVLVSGVQPLNAEMLPRMKNIPLAADGGLDVTGLLAAKPDLIVVDDIHAENPAGARHPRRYQDVQELLESGQDVFAALDVQHLESLIDDVYAITGYREPLTVPDEVIDKAAVIELVDLPPEELLQRFRAGRVAAPELSLSGAEKFFRLGNLIALRELALRRAAGRVEAQMRAYMRSKDISGPWAAGERIMVCVSSHPLSERLVRAGRRLAGDLKADWVVVYVETPERARFSATHAQRLAATLRLAEQLGARVERVSGRNVPEAILTYARQNNITKLIIGSPARPRWQKFLYGSVVEEIIRHSGSIGVYVLSDERGPLQPGLPETWRPQGHWLRYLWAILLVALITLISYPIHLRLEPTNLAMFYLLGVLAAAIYLGRGPALLTALLGVLSFDFFLIEPRFSLSVEDTQYLLTFLALFVVGTVVSGLAGTVRDQVESSQRREAQTSALYALSRDLTIQLDLPAVMQTVLDQVGIPFGRQAAILLPTDGKLTVRASSPGFAEDDVSLEAAEWAFKHGQPSGRGTNTLPQIPIRFQPLRTGQGAVGVLAVRPSDSAHFLSPDQRQLLEAYSGLAALAIERVLLAEEVNQTRLTQETEKLQTALLNSISHDLRTPLAVITGALSSLHEAEESTPDAPLMDHATRLELIDNGWSEAERLNRLVGNLLDMTRLEAGALHLRRSAIDVEEAIGAALDRLHSRLKGIPIETHIPAGLPPVSADALLLEQVLVNLLDNAAKYTEGNGAIGISARALPEAVEICVADHGPGIPPEDLERIFDKFYRVQAKGGPQGTGLGLSICKGIIEAHGGQITARNRPEGGAEFAFTLPQADVPRERMM
ncbi:osmosensitive K+ channel histidine kinase [Longilinea arvoryzae]|uniref:histidine kinase n=1 Tax=Longilinea arvoryzae TaxID=360412 RepID=A0A0S7B7G1_9CHLR|nr:sensor histidine kinase KdpD [Longilinea arvoryzae]GAP13295.1 osmosensitive K+ channel histidine kinase [Longilinea arvoryzae]